MTKPNLWAPARVMATVEGETPRQFYVVSEHEAGVFQVACGSDGGWTIRLVLHTNNAIPDISYVTLGEPVLDDADIWSLCSMLTAMGATVCDALGVPK